ncbi:protein-L-isoaspartate(D-aspartate) O-methyltransferase [Mesorhizobium xinjiangense]|uniref:protein-L-isoaspartate(D-aspartate) O-methyltransferase n=1 Tax=Mesorhizobium xinjiangense TaxID=2678685 RepID=UPI0012ECD879|nr:protein-L-isoaspartate(D-aspartate) O-methyltransferase [Mesorhizobium xinjiangense]
MIAPADERECLAAFYLRMRARGIENRPLVAAVEAVPRRNFVPAQWRDVAWSDRMIPIECGEVIEGIDLQAAIIHALQIEPGHRVLEVGTGSGYTAALMSKLATRVTTVDRYKTLTELAHHRLQALDIDNALVRQADASNGMPGEGPFDRIVCWAAFDGMPRPFVDLLSSNGVMIAPIGPGEGEQTLARLTKVGSRFDRQDIGAVRLQPLTPGVAAAI